MTAKLLVVGDLGIDIWNYGTVERMSPEAAVPVFKASSQRKVQWGMAANVAICAARMGADVVVAGRLGSLPPGMDYPFWNGARFIGARDGFPLSRKTRFVTETGQVMRLDEEVKECWGPRYGGMLSEIIEAATRADVVLIADYGKGVVTRELCQALFQVNKRCIVDPARGVSWEKYKGAWGIKCNRVEFQSELRGEFASEWILRTLGCEGAVLASRGCVLADLQSDVIPICDPCGCGDQVMATLGVLLAEGMELKAACERAIEAGTIQATRPGIIPVERWEIEEGENVVPLEVAVVAAGTIRACGQRVVLASGCFDLLHAGHVRLLHEAAKLGDCLIVGVNSDASYREIRGKQPLRPEGERASILAALDCVSCVTLFHESDAAAMIRLIRPDFFVKGTTSPPLPEAERLACEECGVVAISHLVSGGESSTAIRQQLAERA